MKSLIRLVFIVILFSSCNDEQKSSESDNQETPPVIDTTAHFLKEGKLVALIENNVTSYYINKGQPRGFEYEMLKAFCDDHDLELEVKMIAGVDYIADSILRSKADVGAGNLTITGDRKKKILFTPPLLKTKQVLVQSLPENYKKLSKSQIKKRVVTDALDLDGKSVYVNVNSSYKLRLENLANENGIEIHIQHVNDDMGIDELVELVSRGEITYTILDENLAQFYKKLYPNLHITTPISLSQNIAWMLHPENVGLQRMISEWFDEKRNGAKWNTIYRRYFKVSSKEMSFLKHHLHDVQLKEVSPYDKTIKRYAAQINWDWRLVASLIKKESNFNPSVQSPFGATGLMQLLPTTAERFGVSPDQLYSPEQNIKAGTQFLDWLGAYWTKHLGDSADLTPYILASYNAGPGHVQDAIKLARKFGYDPFIWEGNVELMLYNKSNPTYYRDPIVKHGFCRGREPVNYVKEIMKYYNYYKVYNQEENVMQTAYR